MDALGGTGTALGVADDPAHGVAGGNRTRTYQLFASLQRDVGHFAGRGIDLIERAIREGIDLDRVDIAVVTRFDARILVGVCDDRARRLVNCLALSRSGWA